MIDPVELLLGIAREDEVVVLQVLVAAVQAEVEDDARTSRFATSATGKAGRRRAAYEFLVGAHRIHVGDDGAERDALAIRHLEPLHTAVADQQPAHVGAGTDRHPKLLGQARERRGHGAGPSFGYQTPSPTCICAMAHSTAGAP